MAKFPDAQTLKARVDLPALISQWVPLHRDGTCYKGFCPFHDDKNTPSFAVYPDHYFCFGCRTHGDVYKFLQLHLGLNFREALVWVQEHIGALALRTGEFVSTPQSDPTTPIAPEAIDYWHRHLTLAAREYYYSRMLTDETIDQYKLGWDGECFVIPIWEGPPGESEVYGVKFRRLEGEPRYFGIRGRQQPRLFNKYILDGSTEAFIFFGEFDALLATQDGLSAVSPTSGQNGWLPIWYDLFVDAICKYVIPDVGELSAGYVVAHGFSGDVRVGTFLDDCGKDYTEFRQNGFDVDDFRAMVLQPLEKQTPCHVEPYWEGA